MSDRDALLRSVLDAPQDDAPRLVMADWLDEHGEPELAEILRDPKLGRRLVHLRKWYGDTSSSIIIKFAGIIDIPTMGISPENWLAITRSLQASVNAISRKKRKKSRSR